MADITQIRNMYLMLGTSCNMTCRHCSQIPVKGKKVQKQECSVAVLNFIKQWDNERTRPKTLWFWGGEPLLYLKNNQGYCRTAKGYGHKVWYIYQRTVANRRSRRVFK